MKYEQLYAEPAIVEEPDLSGNYTVADYVRWQFDGLVELINGKIFKMSPAPVPNHQRLSMSLSLELAKGLKRRKCEVFAAPFDVYLAQDYQRLSQGKHVVQPDLCVICDSNKITDRGCMGAPDFIVEILSPATRTKDLTVKRDLYLEFKIPELWIVSPEEHLVLVHHLKDNIYVEHSYTDGSILSPLQFPDIYIDLEKLFKVLK